MPVLSDVLRPRSASPVSARLGVASACAGLGWIAWLALTSAGAVTPWLLAGAALLVGGLSMVINGLIGHEVAHHKELQRDLQSAARIQRSLFPGELPHIAGCEFAMACRMSREIGGDCVDAFALDEFRVALLVGDVSGKGIAAALVMSGVHAQFRALAQVGVSLPAIADRIDQQLREQGNGRYITAVMLLLDVAEGTIEYLSAGHVPFLCLEAEGEPLAIDSTGPPLGLLPGITRVAHRRLLPPGAALILVTDGVTERLQGTVEYGMARLLAATASLQGATARDAVDALLADNDRFAAGAKADDDLTVVMVRRRPPGLGADGTMTR